MLRQPNSKCSFYMVVYRDTTDTEDYKHCSPGTLLFRYLQHVQANGEQGDTYRELLKPTFTVWQETGISDCFETAEQAWAVVDAIEARQLSTYKTYDFRVVHRSITQTTARVERAGATVSVYVDLVNDDGDEQTLLAHGPDVDHAVENAEKAAGGTYTMTEWRAA